jgi:hypothetical protein
MSGETDKHNLIYENLVQCCCSIHGIDERHEAFESLTHLEDKEQRYEPKIGRYRA